MNKDVNRKDNFKITEKMIDMYEQGMTLKTIGEVFGITKQAVSLRMRNYGYISKVITKSRKESLDKLSLEKIEDLKLQRDKQNLTIANLKNTIAMRENKIKALTEKNKENKQIIINLDKELRRKNTTLDEIEEICKRSCINCTNIGACECSLEMCLEIQIEEILQKIQKVKGNE